MNDEMHRRERAPVAFLDPERDRPGYWLRMRERILTMAEPELVRRRRVHDITVSDVVFSWARSLVPTTLAAALVAGMILARPSSVPTQSAELVPVEEILIDEMESEGVPAIVAAMNDLRSVGDPVTMGGF